MPVAAHERPPEPALHEAHVGLEQERTQHPRGEVGGEPACVRVQVGDQLAACHRQRPPHGVPLAERRPEIGQELRLLMHLGAEARSKLGRAVIRGGIDHEHLVHEAGQCHEALHDRPDGVGHLAGRQHHGHVLLLALQQQLQGELGVVKGADQPARTMAFRDRRSDDPPMGAGARHGARRGARSHRPRGLAARLSRADPRRSAPGPARVARLDRVALVPSGRHARGRSPRPHDRDHRPRPAESRSPSTSRCSTRWPAIRGRAPSTCIRRRRWPRTRRAGWRAWAEASSGRPSTTATRPARSAPRSGAART